VSRPCGQRIALVVWQDQNRARTGLSAVEILGGQDLAVLAVQQAVSCHDPDLARNGLVITAGASFELSDPTLKSCHLAYVLLKAPGLPSFYSRAAMRRSISTVSIAFRFISIKLATAAASSGVKVPSATAVMMAPSPSTT